MYLHLNYLISTQLNKGVKKTFCLIVVCFCFSLNTKAQKYNFTTYTVADGLPNNHINDVHQDKYGRLWVATSNGVCRYDGASFIHFNQDNPLSNNAVKTIYEDSDGNIWLGTVRKGVCVFSGTTTKFLTIQDGLLSDIVNAITKDKTGKVWIGTAEGLCVYDGKKFTNYTTLTGLLGNYITSLYTDKAGNVWIGTLNGLMKYSDNKFYSYTINQGLSGNLIYSVTQTKDNKIYISTNNGYTMYDGNSFHISTNKVPPQTEKINAVFEDYKGNKWFATAGSGLAMDDEGTLRTFNQEMGLSSNFVLAIAEDREGNLWLGTINGLCRYSGDRFVNYMPDENQSTTKIISAYADKSDNIWFGTISNGLYYFDGSKINTVNPSAGLRNSTVWSIIQATDSTYWVGTTNGVALLNFKNHTSSYPLKDLNNKTIYSIYKLRNQTFLFGTDNGLYSLKDTILTISFDSVYNKNFPGIRSLHQDSKGIVWIGTMQGLYFLNKNTPVSFNETRKLPKVPVTSITEDNSGQIIFSTYDFGFYVFNRVTNNVTVVNTQNGIYNNRILFSYIDRNNRLWLGTPEGLDRVDWNTFQKRKFISCTHFDKSNGYYGVETNAGCGDAEGYVWFGTSNGAIRYNPKTGYGKNVIPTVNINNIQVYLKDVDWKKENVIVNKTSGLPVNPELGYGSNNLTFYFTGIYLTAPNEVKYRWKLEGFDDYWAPVSRYAQANYSNIPPGDYVFIVQATVNEREWSPEVSYPFTIKPPAYRTATAYIIYTIAAILLVFLLLWWRTRSLRLAQFILRNKVNERTIELKEKNIELAKLSLVASETGNAVMIFDKKMELEWVNNGFTKMTGFTQDEFVRKRGINIKELTNYKDIEMLLDDCVALRKSFIYESDMIAKDGRKIVTSSTLSPVFDDGGNLKNLVVVDTDITLRTQMEEQIRKSLEEKGFLLKEIHHRVKNNLQIIISLFNLQANYIHDEKAATAIREGQDRIRSMSLIHERFYQSEGLSKIDFDDYINRLCETLVHSSYNNASKISLQVNAEKISLDIDTAVPCGLIINELVSNAVKYAFTGKLSGIIKVEFRKAEGGFELRVSDNGIGLPPGFDYENSDSLGIQLISALVSQIDGTMQIINDNGLSVTIKFKPQH